MKRERAEVTREELKELPKLRIIVVREGERVRTIELSDPRQEFIAAFNERCRRRGLTAVAG